MNFSAHAKFVTKWLKNQATATATTENPPTTTTTAEPAVAPEQPAASDNAEPAPVAPEQN